MRETPITMGVLSIILGTQAAFKASSVRLELSPETETANPWDDAYRYFTRLPLEQHGLRGTRHEFHAVMRYAAPDRLLDALEDDLPGEFSLHAPGRRAQLT